MPNLSDVDGRKQGKTEGQRQPPAPRPGPRPVGPDDTPAWTDNLIKDSDDRPAACLFNACLAFSESPIWFDRLAFDESAQQVVLTRSPFWADTDNSDSPSWKPRVWSDADDTLATCWLQSQCRIMVSSALTSQAIESAARQHPFHPIRNYLNSLTWDGVSRIDTWLSDYLGVEYSPITSAFASRFLISCVARAFHPGCKVDTCLFVEGEQGKFKSTALEILAGGKDYFTDELPDIRNKDAAIQLCGKWIIELGERAALHGIDESRIKQFLSRSTDRYRPPFGRRAIDVPRGCVFVGTVNAETYLHDETGGRRYWPVEVKYEIDLDGLRSVRDHLWAEAVVAYRNKSPWWLETDNLKSLAGEEQSRRYVADECMDTIARYIGGRLDTSVSEVATCALNIPALSVDSAIQTKIAKILRFLGWRQYQPLMPDGSRPRRYRLKNVLDPNGTG